MSLMLILKTQSSDLELDKIRLPSQRSDPMWLRNIPIQLVWAPRKVSPKVIRVKERSKMSEVVPVPVQMAVSLVTTQPDRLKDNEH